MQTKVYKELAQRIQARMNCEKSGNTEWLNKHEAVINELIGMLPHGSGLNYEWELDYKKSHANNIILYMSYDTMDEAGYYDIVVNFTLQITPSLISGYDLHIKGNFGKYQDIKDYLYDILHEALNQDIDTDNLVY